jgi:hypothetical protein
MTHLIMGDAADYRAFPELEFIEMQRALPG